MALQSGDISKRVFRRVQRDDMGEVSLDSKMLKTLIELDGKRTLQEVAEKIGISMNELAPVVWKLLDLGLIESAADTAAVVNHDFFASLRKELSLAIGPIADILIEDALMDLNYTISNFPATSAPELVEMLARQIQRDEKRVLFQQKMLEKLKQLGFGMG